jgi:hypothetical protein
MQTATYRKTNVNAGYKQRRVHTDLDEACLQPMRSSERVKVRLDTHQAEHPREHGWLQINELVYDQGRSARSEF